MLYKNTTTGGLIETGCSISGGDWELVSTPKKGGSKSKGKDKDAAGAGNAPAAGAKKADPPAGTSGEAEEDLLRSQGGTLGKAGEDAPAEP